jgi:hypothetical protein
LAASFSVVHKAIKCLDTVIQLEPNSLLEYYNKGRALQQSKNQIER